jgi:hypothetical protein
MTVAFEQKPAPSVGLLKSFAQHQSIIGAAGVPLIFCAALIWTWIVRAPFRMIEGSDDAFFLEVAHLWTRGAPPDVGAFDIKPPGLFAILAAVETFLGPGLQTIKSVSIFFDAVSATALYFIGSRMGSRAIGACAGILYPFLSQYVASNSAYPPLDAFTILAFLAALSPLPIGRRAVLTGLAIGVAFTVKQTAAFESVALFAILASAPEAASRRRDVLLSYSAAAAIAPVIFVLYFAAHGAAEIMIADVVATALRRPDSAIERMSLVDGVLRAVIYLARPIEPIFVLVPLALLRRRAIVAASPNAAIGAIGVWALSAVLSIFAQHALFRSYLAPTFAPFTLLAGAGLVFGAPELQRIAIPVRLVVLGLATASVVMINWKVELDMPLESHALDVAAQTIKARNPAPGDKLFVVSRGMWLYMATDLSPPTAYFHWEHTLCDFPGAGLARLADDLAAKPRFIVVSDRTRYVCEMPESWSLVDQSLARSYQLIAHTTGAHDYYDIYEATPHV